MKANMINKLGATTLLCTGMFLASAAAATAAFQPHVLVGHYPSTAAPGEIVRIPVQLNYQDPGHGNRWVVLPGRTLSVEGYLSGGTMHDIPFAIGDVKTDANGQATISFAMPHKLRNRAGAEVGTALRVTAKFAAEPPNLRAGGENTIIHIVVR